MKVDQLTKADVVHSLNFGFRIAEEEIKDLAKYFVETEQWRQISSGSIDIVYGPKGSGKSALYGLLLDRQALFLKQGIILIPGENPRGTPVFQDLVNDPPTTEVRFVRLWKLYLLSIVGQYLHASHEKGPEALSVIKALRSAGLLENAGGLEGLLQSAMAYLKRVPEALEAEGKLDGLSGESSLKLKICFQEPTAAQAKAGVVSVNSLFQQADRALAGMQKIVWLLIDRLDVAFAETADLEANALRALFKTYLDLNQFTQIKLKIFLRTDIWDRVTSSGFREASHITKTTTIKWDRPSLLNLMLRRAVQSTTLLEFAGLTKEEALGEKQHSLIDVIFPEQVEVGQNKPATTFDWILGHTKDGSKENAPRELIHFLLETREEELRRLEIGGRTDSDALFTRQSIRNAWEVVSEVRLKQTLYAEFPMLKPLIASLNSEKASQHYRSLAKVWNVSNEEARQQADKLADVGFFEKRGEKKDPEFWVPFLYRPALKLVMGKAEKALAINAVAKKSRK